MARTMAIMGSDEVMAMFGTVGNFYRGKWENIKVTGVGPDEDTPLEVRRSLVGLVISTIFTKESIERQTGANFYIPVGSRLAYSTNVIDMLRLSRKNEAAQQLEKIVPSQLDMYVFEKEIYELHN